ncbi:hypothetical protein [Caballeronia sp. LZ034LL]|uniref:hypothetical protein n=1 Tax=Caballeronia sp. LZ034LL TaxID=3038567 RepID=UPI00286497EB|nr:hypothetical protein [Caballeronia sp. LZ034LL]MDR5833130.1 hypothetical protein [Caballeronia sp. LZ034LL]
MTRFVYNLFVRFLMYVLPLWLGAFELTVHQAMKEKDPDAFLAPGLMLGAIALLIPLCLAAKAPDELTAARQRFKYQCDIALILLAATLAVAGMPIWHQILGASLSGDPETLTVLVLLSWSSPKAFAMLYYFLAVSLTELKRLTS